MKWPSGKLSNIGGGLYKMSVPADAFHGPWQSGYRNMAATSSKNLSLNILREVYIAGFKRCRYGTYQIMVRAVQKNVRNVDNPWYRIVGNLANSSYK